MVTMLVTRGGGSGGGGGDGGGGGVDRVLKFDDLYFVLYYIVSIAHSIT